MRMCTPDWLLIGGWCSFCRIGRQLFDAQIPPAHFHGLFIFPDAVDLEYDFIDPTVPTPESIESLAHSPVTCQGFPETADMTYYTAKSKAGVFDAASQGWVQKVKCFAPVSASSCSPAAQKMTENVMTKFAAGPAGVTDPSVPNLSQFGITLQDPIDP